MKQDRKTAECHRQPMRPRDLMAHEPEDLELAEDQTLDLASAPDRRFIFPVVIQGFEDLQVLGAVPRDLDESAVRQAIEEDDDRVLRIAESATAHGRAGRGCGCGSSESQELHESIGSRYRSMRTRYNPGLAKLLSERLDTRVGVDSPTAG